MLLPRVGETHSTAQFIYSVFCQCPADGGDCMSRVNGNKNCMRNAMSREISHVNLKKKINWYEPRNDGKVGDDRH